jgi:hypothetical protein
VVEVVSGAPDPGSLWSGMDLISGAGPGQWAAQLAQSRQDLGARLQESFLTRVIARRIRYSHRGRLLNRPQVQTRAALRAAKLTGQAGGLIDVRL